MNLNVHEETLKQILVNHLNFFWKLSNMQIINCRPENIAIRFIYNN